MFTKLIDYLGNFYYLDYGELPRFLKAADLVSALVIHMDTDNVEIFKDY